jgi:coenzyme F420-0:L-glutamate ligase/coenzyme F420-1:gamma-L-glutamate ligase
MSKRFTRAKEQPKLRHGGNNLTNFTAFALEGFPLVKSGDNVAKIIVDTAEKNGLSLKDGDILVIAQKIFSKAEERVVTLKETLPSERAREIARTVGKSPRFVELVLRETRDVLKASQEVLLVRDKRGLTCINAGIDKSNVEGKGNFALLPEDPDLSARRCRAEIKKMTGRNVAVVICDTYSRPFRRGQVNFAIGLAGINPFKDYRRKKDLFGQILKVKNIAVVDEIAAAAELLMGQAQEAMPVVIFRGLDEVVAFCEKCRTIDLSISSEEDLFKGTL